MESSRENFRRCLAELMTDAGLDVARLPAGASATILVTTAAGAGLSQYAILRAKAASLGVPYLSSLSEFSPWRAFVGEVPIAFARRNNILGLISSADEDKGCAEKIVVAVADPFCREPIQAVERMLGKSFRLVASAPDLIAAAINHAYQQRTGQARDVITSLDRERAADVIESLSGPEDLLDNAARAPVIKLVNLVLFEAANAGASDVHVQPYEDRLVVRLRIDGMLFDAYTLPKKVQDEVISRIKVLGRMNIAEKRLAQDGRATAHIGDRVIDLRIASLPTSFGERVVIRLLDKSARLYDLAELGLDSRSLKEFERLLSIEHGLILVTGPTGSGKSTTLYSALNRINAKEKNILTLEDPIEYQLEGISQTQVSDRKGMTFASGLRSVLRQDPDVMMVGEIRDLDTATMAIQSSLTGHLVFSTLHTNDASTAVARLLDLGIEPYLVASSLVGVLAQRLVRRVCDGCSRPYQPTPLELQWLGVDIGQTSLMKRGTGCSACRETGYRGRVGTFELLALDDCIRALIQSRATSAQIKSAALATGVRTLRDDGIHKILAGLTTISEVERVTLRTPESFAAEATVDEDDLVPSGAIGV